MLMAHSSPERSAPSAILTPTPLYIAADEGHLALLASAGKPVNAQQKAVYYAAESNALKPQESGKAAARIFAVSGVRLRESSAWRSWRRDSSAPHTDSHYQVDVAELAIALVANGLMRPFAQVLAEQWNVSVMSLLATPLAIPTCATFLQTTQIPDDPMHRLGQSPCTRKTWRITLTPSHALSLINHEAVARPCDWLAVELERRFAHLLPPITAPGTGWTCRRLSKHTLSIKGIQCIKFPEYVQIRRPL